MIRIALQAVIGSAVLAVIAVGPVVLFASTARLSGNPGVISQRMPCGMTGAECAESRMLASLHGMRQ
ncbi:hypothetical protein [Amorphus coralli]|uniref:hypothetical protein n=1 Tax=Amorphus coralli TaxID=340680 RepID=UPI00037588EF|nr:hypothetical protein [Amorphus coralli]